MHIIYHNGAVHIEYSHPIYHMYFYSILKTDSTSVSDTLGL